MKYQHLTKIIAAFALCLFITITSSAQVFVKVIVLPPYSSHITDFASHPERVSVTLQNQGNTALDIQLRGSMKGDNGVALAVNKNYKSPSPLHLAPLETKTLSGSAINSLFDYNQLIFNGITKAEIIARGNLPEGNYQICAQAYDYNTNTPLSEDECSNIFPLASLEAPYIIKPANSDNILPVGNTQNFVITWSTPAGAPPSTQYNVRIVEILDNRSPENAIQSSTQPPFFQQIVSGSPALVYGPAQPALTPGRRYALVVQAKDPSNSVIFRNNGMSEAVGFVYGDNNANGNTLPVLPADDNNTVSCGCKTIMPANTRASNKNIVMGGTIKAGNFSITVLGLVKNSDNTITGTGKVNLPMINSSIIPVGVEFTNILVNSSNELVGGRIRAQVKPDVNFLPSAQSPNPSLLPFSNTDVDHLGDYIDNNKASLVSQMKNAAANTVFKLPIGIDKQMAGSPITIEIIDLTITPVQATIAAATIINTPDDAVVSRIALGAKNICINPTDLCGETKLFLATNVLLPSLHLTLKGVGNVNGGTYVVFDKDGFKNLQIVGDMALPQSLVVKKVDFASPVVAEITATTDKGWNDWMANVSIDPFIMTGNKDFSFTLNGNATYDHSDVQNPVGLPTNIPEKPELAATQWHGFYLPQLTLGLPAVLKNATGQPLTAAVQNLIIDGNGVTAKAGITNLLQIGNGSLGGWYYSIDNLGITIINNAFKNGGMDGKLVLPISGNDYDNSTNQLNYHCLFSEADTRIKFQFALNVAGSKNISVPMWIASLNVYNSSNITITAGQGDDFEVQATLNGDLSIDINKDPFGHINFKLIEVEGLQILNKNPYLKITSLHAGTASPNKSLANLPVALDPPTLEARGDDLGINFGMGIGLGDENKIVPSARFSMFIGGKIAFYGGRPNWTYDKIYPEQIAISAGILGPVDIEVAAGLDFIKGEFGNAVQGTLKVKFIDAFTCDANVLFGKTDGPSGYPYFYVDAAATFQPGLPLCTLPGPPISVFGFGGGVFFNLARKNLTPQEAVATNIPASQKYGLAQGQAGFNAKILMGTNDGYTFLSSGKIEMGMSINAFSLSYIDIDLTANYLCSSIDWNPAAAITGKSMLKFDFAHNNFNGTITANLEYPPGPAAFMTGQIAGDFHFGDNTPWHISLGTPTHKASIAYQVPGLGLKLSEFKGYFWLGDDGTGQIPPPDAPTDNLRALLASAAGQINRGNAVNVANGPASGNPGLAFGASLRYGDQFTFGPVYAVLTLGGGFDMNLTKYTESCSGNAGDGPPGFDGWYARGQLYLYFEGGGGVRCSVLGHKINAPLASISTVATVDGGLPNPLYFTASLAVRVQAAFGLIDNDYKMRISVGKKCVNNTFSSPITIPIISDIQPTGGTPGNPSNPSIWTNPRVAFNFPVNQVMQLSTTEDDGNTKIHSFRITLDQYEVKNNSTGTVVRNLGNSNANFAPDYLSAYLYDPSRDVAFDPNTTYTITVHVVLTEVNPISGDVTKTFGNGETKVATFISGPCVLEAKAILATFPLQGQRYFLSGDYHTGTIYFAKGLPGCLKVDDANYTLYAEFIPYQNGSRGTPVDIPVTYSSSPESYTYSIPDLPVNSIIKLRIVKKLNANGQFVNTALGARLYSTTMKFNFSDDPARIMYNNNKLNTTSNLLPSEIEVMKYYFKTSKYKTLNEKITSMQNSATGIISKLSKYTMSYTATYNAGEKFDTYDADGYINYQDGYEFWIAPLVALNEDFYGGNNTWYNDYVNNLYSTAFNLSSYASECVHINDRSDSQLADVGSKVPTGPIKFTPASVDPPLTYGEISSMLGPLYNPAQIGATYNINQSKLLNR